MKAALLYDVGDLRLVDVPTPETGPDGVLVRVTACAVCPTDIRKFRTGDNGELKFPFNMGHEWVGEVVKVGQAVSNVQPGARVVGGGYLGYAEYAPLKNEMLRIDNGKPLLIPETVTDEEATFVEPLADNIHAVLEQAKVSLGQTLLIIGAGQMALQQMLVAKLVGASTIVSEPIAERRKLAERLGADLTIDGGSENVPARVRELTGGVGADAAILSVGSPEGMLTAIESVRTKGRVVLFGGFERGTTVTLNPNIIHYRELEVVGSEWVGIPPHQNLSLYRTALRLIEQKKVQVADLITHRVALPDIHEAFDAMRARSGLKAVVHMNGRINGQAIARKEEEV
jgi:L-iditol 2-dehydrogenase